MDELLKTVNNASLMDGSCCLFLVLEESNFIDVDKLSVFK